MRASSREVDRIYGRVVPRISLRQEIFDSLEPSKNEDVEAISVVASTDIMKIKHLVRPATDSVRVKVMIEDALEHVVQNAYAIHSLFVVAARQYGMLHMDAQYWVKGSMVGDGIFSESITVAFEEMTESEKVRLNVYDKPVI